MEIRKLLRKVGYKIVVISEIGISVRRQDLSGDRDVEHSWIAANLPTNPGKVLDFGCGTSPLGLLAAMKGGVVTAFDQQKVSLPFEEPNLKILRGDLLDMNIERSSFDVIINCSSIEHVGLAGRYGSKKSPDGDLIVMQRLRNLLTSPNGTMLLTLPIGKDSTFPPLHRVYGQQRLKKLLNGFKVVGKEFWDKQNGSNTWIRVPEKEALNFQPSKSLYALGCFILKSSSEPAKCKEESTHPNHTTGI